MTLFFGQVAQLVEQWTENPWVVGSNPTLATFFFSAFLAGCATDPCESLCTDVSNSLNQCLKDWPTNWTEFDYSSAGNYRSNCESRWFANRSGLESRELDDAYEQCEESAALLDKMGADDCNYLRAIYLADPEL